MAAWWTRVQQCCLAWRSAGSPYQSPLIKDQAALFYWDSVILSASAAAARTAGVNLVQVKVLLQQQVQVGYTAI